MRCAECSKWFDESRAIRTSHECAFCSIECSNRWQRRNQDTPTLREFSEDRFVPWAESSFKSSTPNNWFWYRTGIRALLSYKPLADARLDAITNELAAEFASYRLREEKNHKKAQVSTVNSSLRVLRRALRLAAEWSVLAGSPQIALIPGERHRERVITPEEERRYQDNAPEPVRSVSIILADTGMRPEECYRMRWENVNWKHGRFGSILIPHGKTAAARRVIPMTPRVRFVLETRWELAKKPTDGFLWPAPTKSSHIEHSSLKKQHAGTFAKVNKAIREANEKAGGDGEKQRPLKAWVLYSFRHTFLTRLGESGCDAWTLARIAGHSSIAISSRYVHPSDDAVLNAISNLSGHKTGHSQSQAKLPKKSKGVEVSDSKRKGWCARRDSNSRPNAPEAFALSS